MIKDGFTKIIVLPAIHAQSDVANWRHLFVVATTKGIKLERKGRDGEHNQRRETDADKATMSTG